MTAETVSLVICVIGVIGGSLLRTADDADYAENCDCARALGDGRGEAEAEAHQIPA